MSIILFQSLASEDSVRTCMESSANLKCGKKIKNNLVDYNKLLTYNIMLF